ncbi:MAG: hypothetical protein ACRDOP_04365 [Gaiellaceae bacterium]
MAGNEETALDRLRSGDVDIVAVFPGSAAEAIRANERATITICHNRLDPIETEAITVLTLRLIDEANQRVLAGLIGQVQTQTAPVQERTATTVERLAALRGTLERAQQRAIDPNLLSGPLQRVHDLEDNLSEINETLQWFGEFSPEVIVTPFVGATEQATRAALRRDVRRPLDRPGGAVRDHRALPCGPAVDDGGAAWLVHRGPRHRRDDRWSPDRLLVYALGVPLLGSWALLVTVVAALLFTSIGVGFLIALVSKSDSQAVQYAMIVLLAGIFFSSFLLTSTGSHHRCPRSPGSCRSPTGMEVAPRCPPAAHAPRLRETVWG